MQSIDFKSFRDLLSFQKAQKFVKNLQSFWTSPKTFSISKHRSTCHAKNREKIPKPQKRKNRQNSLTFSDISKDGCCTEWCCCVCNSFCGCIVGSNCRGWTGGGVGGGDDLIQTSSSSCSSVFSTLNSVIGMPCVFAKISNSYSGEERKIELW